MIKLIATDMDGTLLDEHGALPKNFEFILNELTKKNIQFVVASGRSYVTLYENFKPYAKDLYFICDNGAYIVEPNRTPIISVLPPTFIDEVVHVCDSLNNLTVLLCGTKHTYIKASSKEREAEINKYYINQKVVSSLSGIKDDIFKISICDLDACESKTYPLLAEKFGDSYQVVVSGAAWIDINNKGINKGMAIQKLQEDLQISYDETMAFGDYYNDIDMLKNASYSFVMENANEDMKQYGNYQAKSNRENGVMKAIEDFVLIENNCE